ncbi:MFS transporter [Pseudomonas weihenstephanensis]|uniref:MFS transporter n=1 Tax=Pseudomonas weihenstephanensis TaxID=1608994 RepID=A0A0J6IIC1_9PSED|nr:MFS transporter [Pseudomonas weihenstephanensis]KMN11902.1 MFS transporter [Pseudomonas weihenstephanensis]
MANPYREIFSAPGSMAFCAAGLIARMPISMTGIGIITLLAQLRGSYWLAGAVAATFALAMALIAPQISRWVDRYGQGRVLPGVTAIGVSALLALLLCSYLGTPDWTLFVFAALAGFIPSMPAMVRARWSELYRGSPKLHTAFSLESVLDEVSFIIGPPISVGLSVAVFPQAGPLVAAGLLAIGVTAFVLQRQTEPPIHPRSTEHGGTVLRQGAVVILLLVLLGMGTIVGTVDVVSVAFAQQQGQPAAASIVLSVYALGSCVVGLIFGTLKLNMPLPKQFLIGALATAITVVPLMWVNSIATLAGAMFVAGLFFAPTLITAMGLVENIVPAAKLTEGLTWMITGLGMGVALGAVLGGWVIDAYGAQAGFAVSLGAGTGVLLFAVLGYRLLHNSTLPRTASFA